MRICWSDWLVKLEQEAEKCKLCSLSSTRKRVVFGRGNALSKIVFVGDYPGEEEEMTGMPFSGDTGKLLRRLIEHFTGYNFGSFFYTNALLCRPPKDVRITQKYILPCRAWLYEVLYAIDPILVIAMGSVAIQSLTDKAYSPLHMVGNIVSGKVVGKVTTYEIPVGILPNPAYLLRYSVVRESSPVHKFVWALQRFISMTNTFSTIVYKTPLGSEIPRDKLFPMPQELRPL